ncbi:DinB family protein [Pontimicrobium aquaticum]|uniref:DinB family protein n=1 Tax=Pontimicrobium aquaticum TaxID=2565367 RepID=A0A4U0F131_9FLAO|nr:DinB family protein [Pontimicrobium aquaticum]TJY38141.1 DinB family protein [Pontimicrobium aquaticum]
MNYQLDIALKNRTILNSFFEKCSLEELNKVPEGFNNNIIWNLAHVIVTQQLLVYELSGLPMMTNDELVAKYRKGTKVDGDVTQQEVDEIKSLLFSTLEQTQKDYENGVFKNYNSYTTSTNSTMTNVEEAIAFNNFHEGIHLGYILALKRTL